MLSDEEKEKGFLYAKKTDLKDGKNPIEFNLVISPQMGSEKSEYLLVGKKYNFKIKITKDFHSTNINPVDYYYEYVILSPPGLPFQDSFSKYYVEGYGTTSSFDFTPLHEGYSYFIQVTVRSINSPYETVATKQFRYNSFNDTGNLLIISFSIVAFVILFIFMFIAVMFFLYNTRQSKKY